MKLCHECTETFSTPGWRCPKCGYEPARLEGFTAHCPELAHGGGGFRAQYFAELATLESANFWFRARNELILRALRSHRPRARSFLEVGCGTGFVLAGIAGACPDMALSGSELFLSGLSHAAGRVPGAELMQMDARQIPFVDEFEVIGAFDVLEHIENDDAVLAQLYKALKPGGLLLLTVPQHPWLWSATDDRACHLRRYTEEELHGKLRARHFVIERSTSFVSLLLPAMLLSRRKKGAGGAGRDDRAELRLSGFSNTVFYAVMKLEAGLIKRGVNFPLGGSRLVLAGK